MTRVLTLNLQHGVLGVTGRPAGARQLTAALAQVRNRQRPDVVALQEVDRRQPRSGEVDQARVAAAALGLPHVRYAAALSGDVRTERIRPSPAAEHSGPAYGVAIASRYPILGHFVRPLPDLGSLLPRSVAVRRGPIEADEPRVLLAAVLATPHGRLAVACTHLSTLAPVAWLQLRQVRASVATLGAPALICGDFNLTPALARLATRGWAGARALTFPVGTPDRQIDHLLLAPGAGLRWRGAQSVACEISDHRALAATLGP